MNDFLPIKKIKSSWKEPDVGDLISLTSIETKPPTASTYDGLIIDVLRPTNKASLRSDNTYTILWIDTQELTKELGRHIRENYILFTNNDD